MTLSFQKPPNPVRTSVEGTVNVTFPGGVDVSAVGGTIDVSAQGGVIAVSARNTVDVSAQGGVVATSVRSTVNVSAESGVMAVSARNTVNVSAEGGVMTVSARAANASVAGSVSVYFRLPSGLITDGAQSEQSKIVFLSGASAGTYKLVSAATSGVLRITRLFLVASSAVKLTFRQTSAATSSIDFTGPMPLDDKGSIVLDKSDSPWFVTTGAKDFSINVSAGVGINGRVYWY